MTFTRRITALLFTGTIALAACGSSDDASEPVDSEVAADESVSTADSTIDSTTAPVSTELPPADESDEKDTESGEPAPPSRRTTLDDVDLFDPSGSDADFPRAAVPVDAYPADEVLDEPTDSEVAAAVAALATDGHLVIPVVVDTCTLVSVWALPHPGELVVGYEEHPDIDCIRSVPRTVLFTIPVSGENSEGEWNFDDPYDVTLQRRVG